MVEKRSGTTGHPDFCLERVELDPFLTQVDHRPKCKNSKNYKTLRRNTGVNIRDVGLGQRGFLDVTSKATKKKIDKLDFIKI